MVSLFQDFEKAGRVSWSSPFSTFIMVKYYGEVSELLKLGAESFEDELKQIVSSLLKLTDSVFSSNFSLSNLIFFILLACFFLGYFVYTSHPFRGSHCYKSRAASS